MRVSTRAEGDYDKRLAGVNCPKSQEHFNRFMHSRGDYVEDNDTDEISSGQTRARVHESLHSMKHDSDH